MNPPTMNTHRNHDVHGHEVNALNAAIKIAASMEGSGGAYTLYSVMLEPPGRPISVLAQLNFQSKPVTTPADFDGLTNEALLAVLIDRMKGFQSGPFACRENAVALTKMEEALMWLNKRTLDRQYRGVEGTLRP